jgi:L-ascorbate metabolism protein UlaG (beta-lactamase superfamily)
MTGPLRYSMTGEEGVELCRLVQAHTVVPVHYEGWSHFKQGRAEAERAFDGAPDVKKAVRWLPLGSGVNVSV